MFGIPECRGTASTTPFAGLVQSEWEAPSRRRLLRFIHDDGFAYGVGRHATEPFLAPVLKNQGNSLGEVLACFLHREALTVGARDSGQYEMKHSPSRSKIAVNSFRIIGTDPYDTAKSGWLSNTVAPPAAVPSLVS